MFIAVVFFFDEGGEKEG